MKALTLSLSLAAFACGSALAADSPWVGTWKLDPAKSHFTGDTFTYSKAANGMMRYSDGSASDYDFAVDGKPYKSLNRTIVWSHPSPDTWDSQISVNGNAEGTARRLLSADGKTLTFTMKGTRPDGSPYDEQAVYERVGAGEGLLGTWRSVKSTSGGAPQTFVISSPGAGVVHYDVPDMKASVEGATNGTDLALTGPTVPPGMTIAFKAVKPTETKYTIKVNGKPDAIGVQTIAADGRSFSDVSWTPGKESEKQTAVYVKQ
jgi:hypothetical protein